MILVTKTSDQARQRGMYVCTWYVLMVVCMYMYVCMYACMYVCMYVCIY